MKAAVNVDFHFQKIKNAILNADRIEVDSKGGIRLRSKLHPLLIQETTEADLAHRILKETRRKYIEKTKTTMVLN